MLFVGHFRTSDVALMPSMVYSFRSDLGFELSTVVGKHCGET